MRIISGSRRGLRLKGPKTDATRPTEDRIKESLFNILFTIEPNSLVLDLFAGSGSVGLEFLSRGASQVYFVEKNRDTLKVLRENISHCKFDNQSIVLPQDYIKALKNLSKRDIKFDYIFLDPPYGKGFVNIAMEYILEYDLLDSEGLIIIEHEKDLDFIYVGEFKEIDMRDYGTKLISFYRR